MSSPFQAARTWPPGAFSHSGRPRGRGPGRGRSRSPALCGLRPLESCWETPHRMPLGGQGGSHACLTKPTLCWEYDLYSHPVGKAALGSRPACPLRSPSGLGHGPPHSLWASAVFPVKWKGQHVPCRGLGRVHQLRRKVPSTSLYGSVRSRGTGRSRLSPRSPQGVWCPNSQGEVFTAECSGHGTLSPHKCALRPLAPPN